MAIGLQSYRTPPEFLARVLRRLGWDAFEWDLACTRADCVGAAGGYAHPEYDALQRDWTELRGWPCWINPPFAQAGAFAALCASSGLQIAALFPVALGTRWWRAHVHRRASVLGCGRLRFNLPDGTPAPAAINRDVALCVYGHAELTPGYPLEDWSTW